MHVTTDVETLETEAIKTFSIRSSFIVVLIEAWTVAVNQLWLSLFLNLQFLTRPLSKSNWDWPPSASCCYSESHVSRRTQTSTNGVSDSFDLFGFWLNILFFFSSSLHLSAPWPPSLPSGIWTKKQELTTPSLIYVHSLSSPCKLDDFNFVVNVFQCPSLSWALELMLLQQQLCSEEVRCH